MILTLGGRRWHEMSINDSKFAGRRRTEGRSEKEYHKSAVSSTIRGYFGWIGMNSWRFGCRKSTRRQKMKNVDDHEMSLLTLIVGRLSWV